MRAAFGISLEQFVFFGSCPGAAPLNADPDRWRRYILDSLVESAVGAHLANTTAVGRCELLYWRERNKDVDFVLRAGRHLTAIERNLTPISRRVLCINTLVSGTVGNPRPLLVKRPTRLPWTDTR